VPHKFTRTINHQSFQAKNRREPGSYFTSARYNSGIQYTVSSV